VYFRLVRFISLDLIYEWHWISLPGLFPGLNFLISCWYTREQQNRRVAWFFSGATLSGAFGGLLAFGIRHMAGVGGKSGWAWMLVFFLQI